MHRDGRVLIGSGGRGEQRDALLGSAELGVREHDPIGQQVAELGVRPALNDESGDQVQVGARVDVMRDAGGDDGEDGSGAFAADVEPGEEPVLAAEDEATELALSTVM